MEKIDKIDKMKDLLVSLGIEENNLGTIIKKDYGWGAMSSYNRDSDIRRSVENLYQIILEMKKLPGFEVYRGGIASGEAGEAD